ncbi:transmembrane and death domain protein 1 [Sphaerodactylus townsendi]|uniref:transmembrane and death domain protein 1 n=1 Tax=Sphaerodactylus townsendi TaxID=933632 RepID=UPI002025F980|nr:transmembrane and death domain protein 1 [Sphaerodactylus townsendi]
MVTPAGVLLFVLTVPASCDDTVADDIGLHMMGRISELLSPEECQAFYVQITGPDQDVEEELNRLLESKNPIRTRRRRDITSVKECKETLSQWLQTEGDTMYWDRLSRAIQQIGRSDVSKELGKNLNQDKNLEIKKNVEDYHKTVKHLTSSLLLEETEEKGEQGRLRRDRGWSQNQVKATAWEDLELIIEKKPLKPYNRSLFGWIIPLTTGVAAGFLTSFIVVVLFFYTFFWILNQGNLDHTQPSYDSLRKLNLPSSRCGGIYYTYQWLDKKGEADSETEEEEDSLVKEIKQL